MTLYVIRRLLQLIPVLLIVSLIVFLIVHLIPGDPIAVMLGPEQRDTEQYEALRRELGFDQPLFVQYLRWLERVAHGDLGQSLRSKRPVLDIILERYPATVYLAGAALLLGILIAIPAGTVAAVKQNTGYDYGAMIFALFGISVPNFWFALLLILTFGIYFRWFPTIGYMAPEPTWRDFFNGLALPAIVLGTDVASATTRYIRARNAGAVAVGLCPDGASQRITPEIGPI